MTALEVDIAHLFYVQQPNFFKFCATIAASYDTHIHS